MQTKSKFSQEVHTQKQEEFFSQLRMFPKQPDCYLYMRNKISSTCPQVTSFSPPPLQSLPGKRDYEAKTNLQNQIPRDRLDLS